MTIENTDLISGKEAGEIPQVVKVSAPGKLILSGEHAVVYGKPAVITAIDKRCYVSVSQREESVVEIESQGFGAPRSFLTEELIEFTDRSRRLWENFHQTRDKKFLQEINKEPLSVVLIAIGESFSFLEEKKRGLKVQINSSIPLGSGLGSSAAVAVGVIKGVLQSFGKEVNLEELNTITYEVEKRQHGLPSGGDNSIVVFGGFLQFQKINEQFQLKQIEGIRPEQLPPFLLLQSGQPVETTGEMVVLVRERYEKDPKKVGKIIENIGEVTTEFLDLLQRGKFDEFTPLISTNERLLEELGVVGAKAKQIIREIEKLGGVAKICGAGGIEGDSGILLCVHEEPEKLIEFAQKRGLEFLFPVSLGEKGIRREGDVRSQIRERAQTRLRMLSERMGLDVSHDSTHLNNVAENTQLVGDMLGYSEKEKLFCFAAGWLHDLVRSPSEDPDTRDEEKSAHEANLVLEKLSNEGMFVSSDDEKKAVFGAITRHTNYPQWFRDKNTRDVVPQSLEDRILLSLFVADYIEANGARVIVRRCHFVGKERLHTPPEKGGDLQKFGFVPGKDEGLVVAIESLLRLTFINPEELYPDYLRSLVHPLYEVQREFVLGIFKGLDLKIGDLIELLKERRNSDGETILESRKIELPASSKQFERLVEQRGMISDRLIEKTADDVASSALETLEYFTTSKFKNLDRVIERWEPEGRAAKRWKRQMIEYQDGRWLENQKRRISSRAE